jgi:translocation and assembly module TamB
MRYIKKIYLSLIYSLSAFMLLVVIMLILLQNGMLNNHLASMMADQGSKNLKAKVEIGNIQGNPLKRFSLHEIKIINSDSTILTLEELHVHYNPTALFQKKLSIENVALRKLNLEAIQNPDSSWNIIKILPKPDKKVKNDDPGPSEWHIAITRILLDSLTANLQPLNNKTIPLHINLNGKLNFTAIKDSLALKINRFSLKSQSPDMIVKKMEGNFHKVCERITWENLWVDMTETTLQSHGNLHLQDMSKLQGYIRLDPLNMEALHPWMNGMKLYGSPKINIRIEDHGELKKLELKLQEGLQKISLKGFINNVNSIPHYAMTLRMAGVNGEPWTHNSDFRSRVDGELKARGQGFNLAENVLIINGAFSDLIYGDYQINRLIFQVDKNRDTVAGNIQANSPAGNIVSRFNLNEIFQHPHYIVQANLRHIDLSSFFGKEQLHSDLNLNLKTSGKGTNPDSLQTEIHLHAGDSYFLGEPVSAMNLSLHYDRGSYDLRDLRLNSALVDMEGGGNGHLRGKNHLHLDVWPGDIQPFLRAFDLPDIGLQGSISGKLAGTTDSIHLTTTYDLFNLHYDTLRTSRLQGSVSLYSVDSLLIGHLETRADSISIGERPIEQIALTSSYGKHVLKNSLQVTVNDTLSLSTQADIKTEKDTVLKIHDMRLNLHGMRWQKNSGATHIKLSRDAFHIDDFQLQSGQQRIGLNGTLAFNGRENFDLRIENLDISALAAINNSGLPVHGMIHSDIHLGGNAASPKIDGFLNIREPRMDTVRFDRLTSHILYDSDTLNFDANLALKQVPKVHATLKMPLQLSFSESFMMPDRNTKLQAALTMDSLDLQAINPLLEKENMKVSGLINANVELTNTIDEPRFNGKLNLTGGTFYYPKQGIDYKDIELDSRFNNQQFFLDKAYLHSGGGSLEITGNADLSLSSGKKQNAVRFRIDGKDFRAMESNKLEAYIAPAIDVTGTMSNPHVEGGIDVIQSRINADAFREQLTVQSDNPNPPLLVKAISDTVKEEETMQSGNIGCKDSTNHTFGNLNLNLNISIPGNTWVQGKDMNFELQGSLRPIMREAQIDLFGTLHIKRGFFEFYGKKFDFNKGSLIFTGGSEINPKLDFNLTYEFRDPDRELHSLDLFIKGRSRQPQLAFALDGKAIQEKEALSYLLFGKEPGRLTTGEKMSLEENADNIARSLAIGKVTDIVTGSLKSSLGLDMIEVGGGKTWKSGNVEIGKYITKNLYVSYMQTFAFDKREKVIEPKRITLDYQLMRNLFIQATNQMPHSGFDLIFKKTWRR